MQCKHHPDRQAEQFCNNCGIPLCSDCAEEAGHGEYYCFQCAMFQTVSGVSTSLKDKRQKAVEKKLGKKKEWGPFHYFVIVSSVLILVMWSVILLGGPKAPAKAGSIVKNERVFLFLVNSAIRRYAHYEGNKYPEYLTDLVPKYLQISDKNLFYLEKLSYETDTAIGYSLSLVNPKQGKVKIIISPDKIEYKPLPPEESK